MKVKKFKLFYDKDKEQVWLNKMCGEGWAVNKFFLGMYTFEKCEKGEYIYQIDLLDNGSNKEFLNFLQHSSVELVCRWGRWVILRKRSCEGFFELYSDTESKIEQYKRIRSMFILVSTSIGLISFNQISNLFNIENSSLSLFSIITVLGIQMTFLTIFLSIILKCNRKINRLK